MAGFRFSVMNKSRLCDETLAELKLSSGEPHALACHLQISVCRVDNPAARLSDIWMCTEIFAFSKPNFAQGIFDSAVGLASPGKVPRIPTPTRPRQALLGIAGPDQCMVAWRSYLKNPFNRDHHHWQRPISPADTSLNIFHLPRPGMLGAQFVIL